MRYDKDSEALEQKRKNASLQIRVKELEGEVEEQRRSLNHLRRRVWEVFFIATNNRKKVEENSRRITDTKDRYDKIQGNIEWVIKVSLGALITLLIGSAWAWFKGIL